MNQSAIADALIDKIPCGDIPCGKIPCGKIPCGDALRSDGVTRHGPHGLPARRAIESTPGRYVSCQTSVP